jgi:hypothetical protein
VLAARAQGLEAQAQGLEAQAQGLEAQAQGLKHTKRAARCERCRFGFTSVRRRKLILWVDFRRRSDGLRQQGTGKGAFVRPGLTPSANFCRPVRGLDVKAGRRKAPESRLTIESVRFAPGGAHGATKCVWHTRSGRVRSARRRKVHRWREPSLRSAADTRSVDRGGGPYG